MGVYYQQFCTTWPTQRPPTCPTTASLDGPNDHSSGRWLATAPCACTVSGDTSSRTGRPCHCGLMAIDHGAAWGHADSLTGAAAVYTPPHWVKMIRRTITTCLSVQRSISDQDRSCTSWAVTCNSIKARCKRHPGSLECLT